MESRKSMYGFRLEGHVLAPCFLGLEIPKIKKNWFQIFLKDWLEFLQQGVKSPEKSVRIS